MPSRTHTHSVGQTRNNKATASQFPTRADDAADGFQPGSMWTVASVNVPFVCTHSTPTDAADWLNLAAGAANARSWTMQYSAPSGTLGTAVAAINVWQSLLINTIGGSSSGNCSLAANQFTLQPGIYVLYARGPISQTSAGAPVQRRSKMRLFDVTSNAVAQYGASSCLASNTNSSAPTTLSESEVTLMAYLSIATSTIYRLEQIVTLNAGSGGATFGLPLSVAGEDEIYLTATVMQIA